MELAKIEQLLDAYFEGETNLKDEKILRDYFLNENVPTHLLQYKPIFVGIEAAHKERFQQEINLPKPETAAFTNLKYIAVAILVLSFLVGGVYFSQSNELTPEEKEALAAFEESKKAMLLLSQNLNKGAERLTLVNQFGNAKDKVFE
ncbi:hypothetical protein [Aequorivita xiaoshiensis]|uniref:Uncharacterized protein n=1 Tax=Aequorivita xiaoshiensis TaxID=2874476 RepID=A0A9X1R2E7_9FLAO|nr:hypothetical protein [Aequorivita xiaoshiensis]MCG2431044.1 hypothetical protein [Aequorivita xiaoshiensis]